MAKRKKPKTVQSKQIAKAEATKAKKIAKVELIQGDGPPEKYFTNIEKIRYETCEKIRYETCEKIRYEGCEKIRYEGCEKISLKKDGPDVLARKKERGRKKAARIKAKYEKLRDSQRIAIAKRLKDKES